MKRERFLRLSLVSFILFFVLVGQSEAACIHIGRTLKQGMSGNDVKELQKFLNSDKRTLIATSGLGSPGKESLVFGKATLAAVKRFQALYKETVLTPAGLKVASGVVGTLSREAIAAQSCTASTQKPVTAVAQTTSKASSVAPVLTKDEQVMQNLIAIKKRLEESAEKRRLETSGTIATTTLGGAGSPLTPIASSGYVNLSNDERLLEAATKYANTIESTVGSSPIVDAIAPIQPLPGLVFRLMGSGFTRGDTVRIGDLRLTPLQVNASGTLATVLLPMTISPGERELEISNTNGRTPIYLMTIKARDAIGTAPIIESFSPASGNIGTVITLTGRNLSANNDIFTTTKIIKGISSSDGRTLTFTLQAEDGLVGRDGRLIPGLPFSVGINNERGLSDPINFVID